MRLRIAARQSDLARLQAYTVGEAIVKQHRHVEIEYQFKESLGDKNLTDPLWKMPDKGVFTEDFLNDLSEQRCDLVVHSWKDLPVEDNPRTEIAATVEREDVRDLLLFKKGSREKLGQGSSLHILSSSPRRMYNLPEFLRQYLPATTGHIQFHPVRGNIPTRMRKLLSQPEVDGLVLAKAGLDRLLGADRLPQRAEFAEVRNFLRSALRECDWMVLPVSVNPAAAAQGALAVEILKARRDLKELLQAINQPDVMTDVRQEREILASYGGGCHQKIGVTILRLPCGARGTFAAHAVRIRSLRGETDAGEKLQFLGLVEGQTDRLPSPMWCGASEDFFFKKAIPVLIREDIDALYVSSPSAWVKGAEANRQIVWTAGLATWKKLAAQGVWVHGCSEGLGEDLPLLSPLFSTVKCWAKLAHSGAFKCPALDSGAVTRPAPEKILIPTYELVPKTDVPLIPENFAAYYWRSSTLFDWVTRRQPGLVSKRHFCGPGHTWTELRRRRVDAEVLWPAPRGA